MFLLCTTLSPLAHAQPTWTFAVSGDSRNCGDIVMPAIAAGARHDQAAFYWHLGDLRAIYTFDQDFKQLATAGGAPLLIIDYENRAWDDFIQNQIVPFGDMPFFLGTVHSGGAIDFSFHQLDEKDVPPEVVSRFGQPLLHDCFIANRQ